jgi:hypothetical protein
MKREPNTLGNVEIMEFDNKQKVIGALALLVVGYILFVQNQHFVSENRDLILVLVGVILGVVIALIWKGGNLLTAFLDPKEAARLFFINTKFGKDLMNEFNVARLGEGNNMVPLFNLGGCETFRRGDGMGGIYGPIFKGNPQSFYAVFDLRKKTVSDMDSNLVHWGRGPMDTKTFEKELERLVPFESSQAMRLARKAQVEAEKREAEAMAEEM